MRLMSRKIHVDQLNAKELGAIDATSKCWEAVDSYERLKGDSKWDHTDRPWETHHPLKNHSFPKNLTLKVGAKVVLLTNYAPDVYLVNGSQGEVIGFEDSGSAKPDTDDMNPVIEPRKPTKKDPRKYRSKFEPVVRFSNGQKMTISPIDSSSRCGTNGLPYLATRVQIPLRLAWALSIHESQVMTLDYIDVSSTDLFEPGQLYVGLSRGTTLEGVTLSWDSRKQLVTDGDVGCFYDNTEWETLIPEEKVKSCSIT